LIGLLGGAFDPPHVGHVALADAAERQLGLSQLVVVVVASPGHKGVHCPASMRYELARLAFPGRDVELDRHERTVDMLRSGRWADPVFVIGADEFAAFPSWNEPEAVLELARLGVGSRPGYARDRLERVRAGLPRPERVLFFELEPIAVSSQEIRERIGRGEPIDSLVPSAVAAEIASHGLYGGYTERQPSDAES
jgi:nicotinate-nucleotide adenylyltransferase